MGKRQTNILTAEITRSQIEDLAKWWGLYWNERPNTTAVVRQAIERVWTEEKTRRDASDSSGIDSE